LAPATTPTGGAAYAAYDEAHKAVLLLTQDGKTWTWSNGDWRLAATTGPSGRYYGSIAYDPAHQHVVLFGGKKIEAPGGDPNSETWVWDGNKWTAA